MSLRTVCLLAAGGSMLLAAALLRVAGVSLVFALPAALPLPLMLLVRARGRRAPGLPAKGGGRFTRALADWRAGRRDGLEEVLGGLAGEAAAAHSRRVASLCGLLAEQLALTPQEADELVLAGALHVAAHVFEPGARPCAPNAPAIVQVRELLSPLVTPGVVRIAGEFRERWDGAGLPARLLREEVSTGGRILAVACAFDHASAEGLEAGLQLVKDGSATAFDPVVVSELIHLFREPWQARVAA